MDESWEETVTDERRVVLIVPKHHVKTVKTALEQHGQLDRTTRIVPATSVSRAQKEDDPREQSREGTEMVAPDDERHEASSENMRIPTTIPYPSQDETDEESTALLTTSLLEKIGLPTSLDSGITLSHHIPPRSPEPTEKNPLRKALLEVLSRLPSAALASLGLTPDRLVHAFPEGYSLYPPLLLLPHNAFSSPLWKALITAYPVSAAVLQPMWKHIAQAMDVKCIAMNSPIPAQSSTDDDNILRSPVNITPIFGPFGPTPTPQSVSSPTTRDFEQALWVEATQNGIRQVWAPMYTMFSRGNIREKTRILNFPVGKGESGAVVDMYAGIGYFALSYASLGMKPILCFEINPWSVEGLRRGCVRNGWDYKIYTMENMWEWDDEDLSLSDQRKDFYIFQLSNTHALPLLSPHFPTLPPIRHVNLGLLPHSRHSWRDAVKLIGTSKGGWIHAHENVGVEEIEDRKVEVQREFQRYLDEVDLEKGKEGEKRIAEVGHVERVKLYAPGVLHCVFDVWVVGGRNEG